MALSVKVRRTLLVGVALALVAGNVWWFTREKPEPVPDFEMGAVVGQVTVPAGQARQLPRFEAVHDQWRSQGAIIADMHSRIAHLQSDALPAGASNRFVTVGMDAGQSSDAIRAMLLSLARSGICEVAVVQDGDPADKDGAFTSTVSRIVSVRDDAGKRLACIEHD